MNTPIRANADNKMLIVMITLRGQGAVLKLQLLHERRLHTVTHPASHTHMVQLSLGTHCP